MGGISFFAYAAVLALVAGSGPRVQATVQGSSARPSKAEPGQKQDLKTFVGTIAKSGDKWILEDASKKVTYLLDDQERVKQYEGKRVRITGSLDVATNTIRVTKIEASP